jgi:hypothetical protein
MNDITMHETFEEVSNKQLFFKKILVEVGYPFSKVFFKKEDFVLASKITSIKFLGGFNDYDSINRKIFLNNVIIDNDEIGPCEDRSVLGNFIIRNEINLKEENFFTIKIKNTDQIEYIKHLVCLDNYENIFDI